MALSYGAWSAPQPYEQNPDIIGRFRDGFALSRGIADEEDARAALGDYVKSLYLGTASPPSAPAPGLDTGTRLINGAHDAAAAATDPTLSAYFSSIRAAESGGNDAAANPNSTARGRYQFLEPTWNGLMETHPELGLTADGRNDPVQQERAIRAFTSDNIKSLRGAGIPINPGNLYAAHFLGAGGAGNVLGLADDTPLVSALSPEVVQANPQLANMTVGDFRAWTEQKAGGQGGGYAPPMMDAPVEVAQAGNGLPPRDVMLRLFQNPNTREFAQSLVTAQKGGKATDDMREYAYAASQGYQGTFAEWQASNKGGTTVNVDAAGNGGAFGKKADELAAGRLNDIVSSGNDAIAFMGDLRALADLSKTFTSGKAAEITAALGPYAEAMGLDIGGLEGMQAFEAVVARMAPAMRVPGSGASSDFDARQFLKSLPSLGNTPEGNQIINEVFQGIQDRKIKAAEIATQALSGIITWQKADEQIRALGDPYTAFKKFKQTSGDTTGVGGFSIIEVTE